MIGMLRGSTAKLVDKITGKPWEKPVRLYRGDTLLLAVTVTVTGPEVQGEIILNINEVAPCDCEWPTKEEWKSGWFLYPVVLGARPSIISRIVGKVLP